MPNITNIEQLFAHPKVKKFTNAILIIGVGAVALKVYTDTLRAISLNQQIKINKQKISTFSIK